MEESQKHPYVPPVVEVVDVKFEGVICASGGLGDYNKQDPREW